jgi:GAF domain-containing protein
MKEIKIPGISSLIRNYINSEDLPLEARLLNVVYLVGIATALVALITRIAMGESRSLIMIVSAMVCCIALMMYLSNRFRIYTVSRWMLVIIMCNVLFPLAFFALGGLNSAMLGYFVLSIVVIFILIEGKSRIIMLFSHLLLLCLSYYLSSLPFFARFVADANKTNRYLDHIQTFTVAGLCIGIIFAFQNQVYRAEKEKVSAAWADLGLRNKLLQVVNQAAEMLLSTESNDLEKTLSRAMEVMGSCVEADRMYIWKNRLIGGKLRYEQQFEWAGETLSDNTLYAKTGYFYMDTIPAWDELFSSGRHVNGPVSSLSETERNILSPFGIRSILAIPIFLQDKFWGFVSFDDCRKEKVYSEDEVNILRSGSLLLANAVVRSYNELMINDRLNQQKLMSSISQSFISRDPMAQLIQDALKRMGEFMGVSRILVAVTGKNNESIPVYFWSVPGWQPEAVQTGFNELLNSAFPRHIPESGFITALCCNDIMNDMGGKYKIFEVVDLKAFIWAPVYVDGTLWGLVSVEECTHTRIWSESDVQLVGTVSSAIAGAGARDISDKGRAAALDQAVQASKAKGDFLSNMSHEMRTPMNAIIGMTSIGKNATDLEKKDYAFEKIEDASTHLLGVINDILDMSKIEANKLELSPETFDFEDMLQKVVNVINFRIDERKQNFYVIIDKKIPQTLIGDDQRLAQVITNLLGNAVKFTPEEGTIRLTTHYKGEEEGQITAAKGQGRCVLDGCASLAPEVFCLDL